MSLPETNKALWLLNNGKVVGKLSHRGSYNPKGISNSEATLGSRNFNFLLKDIYALLLCEKTELEYATEEFPLVHWVKDLALLLQQLGSLLWQGSNPWSGNSHMPWPQTWQEKKKKKNMPLKCCKHGQFLGRRGQESHVGSFVNALCWLHYPAQQPLAMWAI